MQLAIWVSIVVVGKSVIFGFEFGLEDPLKKMSSVLMGWVEDYPALELVIVIVIVPVAMNALAFWVQDNFLMRKDRIGGEEAALVEEATLPNTTEQPTNDIE